MRATLLHRSDGRDEARRGSGPIDPALAPPPDPACPGARGAGLPGRPGRRPRAPRPPTPARPTRPRRPPAHRPRRTRAARPRRRPRRTDVAPAPTSPRRRAPSSTRTPSRPWPAGGPSAFTYHSTDAAGADIAVTGVLPRTRRPRHPRAGSRSSPGPTRRPVPPTAANRRPSGVAPPSPSSTSSSAGAGRSSPPTTRASARTGPHPYLVGASEGHAVLDAARAASPHLGSGSAPRSPGRHLGLLPGRARGGLRGPAGADLRARARRCVGVALAAPVSDVGRLRPPGRAACPTSSAWCSPWSTGSPPPTPSSIPPPVLTAEPGWTAGRGRAPVHRRGQRVRRSTRSPTIIAAPPTERPGLRRPLRREPGRRRPGPGARSSSCRAPPTTSSIRPPRRRWSSAGAPSG